MAENSPFLRHLRVELPVRDSPRISQRAHDVQPPEGDRSYGKRPGGWEGWGGSGTPAAASTLSVGREKKARRSVSFSLLQRRLGTTDPSLYYV